MGGVARRVLTSKPVRDVTFPLELVPGDRVQVVLEGVVLDTGERVMGEDDELVFSLEFDRVIGAALLSRVDASDVDDAQPRPEP